MPFSRYALLIFILWWFRESLSEIHFQKFLDLNRIDIFSLVILKGAIYFINSSRFVLVAKQMKSRVPYSTAFALSGVGLLTSYLVPSSVLSDASKVYYLKKYIPNYVKIFIALFVDRLSGFLSIVLFFIATTIMMVGVTGILETSIFRRAKEWHYVIVWGGMCCIFGVAFLWKQRRKWFHFCRRQLAPFDLSDFSFYFFLKISLISFVAHFLCVFLIYRIHQLVGEVPLSLLQSGFIFAGSTLGTVVPTTPGAVGVGQAIYKYMIDHLTGTATDSGILVFTLFQLLDIPFLLMGLVFLLKKVSFKKEITS